MTEFTMPALGADMTEGTLLEWLIHPGDQVHKGDIVAVVDTAKAAIEVECFETGVVERLLVEPDETVPVGTPLAVINPVGAVTQLPAPAAPAEPTAARAPAPTPLVRRLAEERGVDLSTVHGTGPGGRITRADVPAAPQPEAASRQTRKATAPPVGAAPVVSPLARTTGRVRATPMARRLAAEGGVDLAGVRGTGTDGAIRAADVRAVLTGSETAPAAQTAPTVEVPPAPDRHAETAGRSEAMRRAIGDLMARSKREIPHYYLSTTIDLGPAVAWLREQNRELPVSERLVPAALLLTAAARAAREVPQLNGFFTDGRFVPAPEVHLGVAVSLRGGGLVAPAIHCAADLSPSELMARLRDVVARARSGRLRGSETTDPTITVTSLGDQGVEAVFGVIYPPQVALVGLGKVVDRPCAVDGLLGVRPVVTATLSADHRASDGATGARYLAALERLLRKPEEL
ncbi:2-oxo acid dehydrogenase subunit E2 [Kitasatospora camelliae]|uniref:Dihydrolipoamide acetyltransferase component of pyruvate dehydrogenase complex n=1 Tax=Kitasatospora camelliae TaxID=3156397 RepID=A0AAU8JR59_9ACTN